MTIHAKKISGEKTTLLLLHGWGQTSENLQPLAELLTSVSTPHLVDLPGFGQSSIPNDIWSAFDYADEMIRHLDQQNIGKISLLGHSFGGKVAMCMAIRYPERVNKLILLAPSGLRPRRTFPKKIRIQCITTTGKLIKSYDRLAGTNHFTKHFIPRFGSADYKNNEAMRPILVRSINEDLTHEITKIQCKTLILWGNKDKETPPEMGNRLHHLIPHSQLYPFPNHDHFLHQDVGAHLCATYILRFFMETQ